MIINRNKTRGFTLIELLIAMTIGLIVMIGVGTVFFNSKQTYNVQEEFSRMQENGRFALDYIARFVRGAGFTGCASSVDTLTNTLNNPDSLAWNFATGVEGYEASGTGLNATVSLDANPSPSSTPANWTTSGGANLPADMADGSADSVLPDSDVLVSRSADDNGLGIVSNSNSSQLFAADTGTVTDGCGSGVDMISGICPGDVVIASDCQKSVAFQVSSINVASGAVNVKHAASGSPGNDITSWGGSSGQYSELQLGEDAEMMTVSTKVFYVGEGVNGPALFMKRGSADGREIIEGVETMQVLYGEDTDADPDNIPDEFVTADNVSDFQNVVAVKVSLLLVSGQELSHWPTQTETYWLTGHSAATSVTVDPVDDQRMRRVMNIIIKLRNRGFSL